MGSKGWRSGESAHLPPMWPGFKSRIRRHMWVEIVVDSLLCSERFTSWYSGFPLSSKTSISKFQFDQESGRRRTTLWMCYLQIIIYFIFCYFILFLFMERIQTAFIASVAVSNCTVPKPLDLWSESKFISARTTLPEKHSSPSRYVGMLFAKDITVAGSCCSAVTKISSCQINTISRWGIKQLVIFSGSIFLLFSYGSSWGIYSWKPEEIPSPQPWLTALCCHEWWKWGLSDSAVILSGLNQWTIVLSSHTIGKQSL